MRLHAHISPYHQCRECVRVKPSQPVQAAMPSRQVPAGVTIGSLPQDEEISVIEPTYRLHSRATRKYPLSFQGSIQLQLEPPPPIDWTAPALPTLSRIRVSRLRTGAKLNAFGNILEDIFGFIFRIIKAIIKKIIAIIEALIYFITHPLELLKAIIIAVAVVLVAPLVLGFVGLGSVTTALFSGVDTIASNFIEQVVSIFTDPIGFLEDSVTSLLNGEVPESWDEMSGDPVSEMMGQGAENVLGVAGETVGDALSGIGDIFPDLELPSITLPEIPLPDVSIPDPGLSLPELSLPDPGVHISLADVTLPDLGVGLNDLKDLLDMTSSPQKQPPKKQVKKIAKVTPKVTPKLATEESGGKGWLALALAAGSVMVLS